jgi:hypothetical protein
VTHPQFPRRAHQLAAEMTPAQHYAVVKLLRLPERSAAAARMVLVDGARLIDAATEHDLSHQSVSRTIGRVRRAHELIRAAYSPPVEDGVDQVHFSGSRTTWSAVTDAT